MKKICLCMIVKNESDVITTCLDSVVNNLDYWVICDTGSTDGTQDIIVNYFKKHNIEGKLFEKEWKNFGHNRTEAFQLAKSVNNNKFDYYMVMDADDKFVGNLDEFKKSDNEYDACYIQITLGSIIYSRLQIFNSKLAWKYVGVLHEYPDCDKQNLVKFTVPNCYIMAGLSSNRVDNPKEKYLKDAIILLEAIQDEPENTRYHFYLAQSFRDSGYYDQAMEWYKKRAELGGWNEEVYYSLYSYAYCKLKTNNFSFEDEILPDFLKAFKYRRNRLESLYEIVTYFRLKGDYKKGLKYGMLGYDSCLNFPLDSLFVNYKIHKYLFMNELAICSIKNDCHNLAFELYNKLIEIARNEETDLDINNLKINRKRADDRRNKDKNVIYLNVKKLNKEQYDKN